MKLSDEIHAVLDHAADEMRGLGMQNPAPFRAMITVGLDNLGRHLCTEHLRADLARIRGMVDARLREIEQ